MTRNEFLNKLEEALNDSVPPATVQENIQFYNDYIEDEESKGRTEEEVLGELGDPRLIAHTIIDTTPEVCGGSGRQSIYDDRGPGRRGYGGDNGTSFHSFNIDMGKWYWKLIAFFVIFAFIILVIMVISGVMTLLMPILPIVFIVGMMMLMFGGHR